MFMMACSCSWDEPLCLGTLAQYTHASTFVRVQTCVLWLLQIIASFKGKICKLEIFIFYETEAHRDSHLSLLIKCGIAALL